MQTSQKHSQLFSSPSLLAGLVSGLLLLAACQPIDPAYVAAQQTAQASGAPAAEAVGTPEPSAVATGVEPASATIATSSLRVRALPSDSAEVIASAKEGEVYSVTGISSDGAWIQIEIDEAPGGLGWISAEFVTLTGDITSIEVVDVEEAEVAEEATEEAAEEATPEATEEATEEVTEEATPEPTEEATPEATEEVTEEATPEATEEAVEEATPEATEEAAEEATPEATEEVTEEAAEEATPEATEEAAEEATEEATPEPTEEATEEAAEEATPEATEEAAEEATPEATEEAAEEGAEDAGLGTVTIVANPPLRVRSEPTTEVDNKIGNVFDGEVYTVLEVSEDGLWVRIETPQFPEGSGWVSSEFVVFNEE